MSITGRNSGTIGTSPTIMAASISPTSRLVKGIIVVNKDSIAHNFTVTCGEVFIKLLLRSGDNLHYNTTTVLTSNDLTAYIGEAVSTVSPTFIVSWLDESETV